jgi:hypothetical protein
MGFYFARIEANTRAIIKENNRVGVRFKLFDFCRRHIAE